MTGNKFNVAVLGGGPGGYTAAIRAAQLGMKVAIIEDKFLGGTCLNVGCIPSKALVQCATTYKKSTGGKQYGITATDVKFDWSAVQKYRERCVIRLRRGVESLMNKNNIEVYSSHGALKSSDTIEVDDAVIQADNIILAPGSYARSLPSLPVDGSRIITSNHALFLKELPRRMLIVGAGAIGCEFAYIMSSFGVEVTMVEYLEHAIPMEDEDVSVEYESILKRQKIKLHTNASVESVEDGVVGLNAIVKPRDGGESFSIETDQVLVSVGRGPATSDCGCDSVGIPMEKGFIRVNEFGHTGVDNIYAIGDATGGLMLAHKASAEGIITVEHIAGLNPHPLTMADVPKVTYTSPEVGNIGLSEKEAIEKFGDSVKISKVPFAAIGKSVIMGEQVGFVKLIAAGDDSKLVGASGIGPEMSDLIAIAGTAISLGATSHEFAHVVQAHPTLAESWAEAGHGLIDGPINF